MLGPELETIYKVCKIIDLEGQKPITTAKANWKLVS